MKVIDAIDDDRDQAGIMTCSICQCDTDFNEGAVQGNFGILPHTFCPWCFSSMVDMCKQFILEEWDLGDDETGITGEGCGAIGPEGYKCTIHQYGSHVARGIYKGSFAEMWPLVEKP